jgi:F-type H+-transporting ATPase subunit b
MAMLPAIVATLSEGGEGFNPFAFAPGATFWTWVIFLASLPVMWKFVFGPITKALADRDQKVVSAAQAAEEARRHAEAAVAGAQAEREQARTEARRMVEEATARAERQGRDALAQAKAEAERQLAKVREEIAAEKMRALAEIRQEVVDLTIASTRQLLAKDVDDEAHRRLVRDFLQSVQRRN